MELTPLDILYRGVLSSCNYDCPYCPFAKTRDTRARLAEDQRDLERFAAWIDAQRAWSLGVLFTPWGEAMIRRWYTDAIVRLSHLTHVRRLAVQTNLAFPIARLDGARVDRVALWCTYHPGEIDAERFLAQCAALRARGIAHSVGVVGLREHLDAIEALRAALPTETYLWINAYKRDGYADDALVRRCRAIDPLYPINTLRYASRGRPCRTGEHVISVDGGGTMRRCHFVDTPIGNLYADDWSRALRPRSCPAAQCGCHIGAVHLSPLELTALYGDGVLERIPDRPVWHDPAHRAAIDPFVDELVARESARAAAVQVSIAGRYADGSSNPAVHATA